MITTVIREPSAEISDFHNSLSDVSNHSITCESDSNVLSLTGFSGLHEVDEHVVDASSLRQHQRLKKKKKTGL